MTSRSDASEPVGWGTKPSSRATGPGSGSPGTATPTATPRAGSARSRVDRHPGLGVGLGQTLGEQLVELRRGQPADVREVGAGDEVPGVRRVRVRVGVVLRQRRVEVGGEPAVDVDVRLQLHELEVDADLGELGLQVLGDVDVRLALAGDDDRLDREAVRVAAVGEQLAGEVRVGAVAGQPVVGIGGVDRPRRTAPSAPLRRAARCRSAPGGRWRRRSPGAPPAPAAGRASC